MRTVRLTQSALAQISDLATHYTLKGRDRACERLFDSVEQAKTMLLAAPGAGAAWPAGYRAIGRWGFRWIKVHRYWFGYAVDDRGPIITNILYESADMPGRIVPLDGIDAPDL